MNKEREQKIRGKDYSFSANPVIQELWIEIDTLRATVKEQKREINILRQYGNKDCTAMADKKIAEVNDELQYEYGDCGDPMCRGDCIVGTKKA